MNIDSKKVSLVMTTYNWPAALDLVLKSVLRQTTLPGEVVIADDGSTPETTALIDSYREKFNIPLKHYWHEDEGYRKTVILNKAMKEITNDYIIQIDGDVILHRKFIEDHLNWCKKGCWVNGSRVLLGPTISKKIQESRQVDISPFVGDIQNRLNGFRIPLLRNLLYDKESFSMVARGCNMAYWKEDFFKVNGFNEDIFGWSSEDKELAARFTNNGIKRRVIKFSAVQHHIYHKLASRERTSLNISLEEQALVDGLKFCTNGLRKLNEAS